MIDARGFHEINETVAFNPESKIKQSQAGLLTRSPNSRPSRGLKNRSGKGMGVVFYELTAAGTVAGLHGIPFSFLLRKQ